MYSVIVTTELPHRIVDSVSYSFDKIEDAAARFMSISLETEFGISALVTNPVHMTVRKELFDGHGTLFGYDYMDFDHWRR